jgi:hypothetical protein
MYTTTQLVPHTYHSDIHVIGWSWVGTSLAWSAVYVYVEEVELGCRLQVIGVLHIWVPHGSSG